MAQANLFDQVGAAVARKGLDQQRLDGQDVLRLLQSDNGAFSDPALGQNINLHA